MPFLAAAGLVSDPPLPAEQERLQAATPLIQERINTLSEAVGLLAFLFRPTTRSQIDPDAGLTADSVPTLTAADAALTACRSFDQPPIEAALRAALVDGLGLKPRLAFGPVRAAITGRRISPPLFESIELLGRESTLARIAAARGEPGSRRSLMPKSRKRHRAGRLEIVTKERGRQFRRGPSPRPEAVRKSAVRLARPSRLLGDDSARSRAAVAAPAGRRRGRAAAGRCGVPADPARRDYVWWRSVLGVVFGLSLFLLLTAVVSQALVTLFWATTAATSRLRDYFARRSPSNGRSACWRPTSASPR